MPTKFLSEKLKGIYNAEEIGVYGKILLEWILGKRGENIWNGCIWFRRGTSGGLL
jgi:hypothetical protein